MRSLKSAAVPLALALLPPSTYRRHLAKRLAMRFGMLEDVYEPWMRDIEPHLVAPASADGYRPLISVITPTYNTPDRYLSAAVASVCSQTYPNWELCIADGSDDPARRDAISKLAATDDRICYKALHENGGIAANTNAALELAHGEFVAFLDHDDLLAPFALDEVVRVLQGAPSLDLVYSDEDLYDDEKERRYAPFMKPDWSPDLLWCLNYITHLVVCRRTLVDAVGGLRGEFDGAQDYDLLLRITERSERIAHVAKILYHWRTAEGSVAKSGLDAKYYALAAGKRAVEEALARRGLQGTVTNDERRPYNYHVHFRAEPQPKVAIVPVPVGIQDPHVLSLYFSQLHVRTDYEQLDLVTKSEGNGATDLQSLLGSIDAEIVMVVQRPYLPLSREWLLDFVGVLQQPRVGAVTGMVVDADEFVIDYGLATRGDQIVDIFRGIQSYAGTPTGCVDWPRDFSALSGNFFAARRETLLEHLDDRFLDRGHITPWFFRHLRDVGFYNVGWPWVKLRVPNYVLGEADGLFNANLVREDVHVYSPSAFTFQRT